MEKVNESEEIIKIWRSLKKHEDKPHSAKIKVVDQIASAFTPGIFFYYIFDFSTYRTDYVHDNMNNMLGLEKKDFSVESYLQTVHPDDVASVLKKEECASQFLFKYIEPKEMLDYKVSYTVRIRKQNGEYFNNLHQAQALNLTNDNTLGKVLCIETDITHLSQTSKNTISFINISDGKSYYNIDIEDFDISNLQVKKSNLTDKELEILKLISYGHTNHEIGDMLGIKLHTVTTHRKNILNKENSSSMLAIVADYLRKGFI